MSIETVLQILSLWDACEAIDDLLEDIAEESIDDRLDAVESIDVLLPIEDLLVLD